MLVGIVTWSARAVISGDSVAALLIFIILLLLLYFVNQLFHCGRFIGDFYVFTFIIDFDNIVVLIKFSNYRVSQSHLFANCLLRFSQISADFLVIKLNVSSAFINHRLNQIFIIKTRFKFNQHLNIMKFTISIIFKIKF